MLNSTGAGEWDRAIRVLAVAIVVVSVLAGSRAGRLSARARPAGDGPPWWPPATCAQWGWWQITRTLTDLAPAWR